MTTVELLEARLDSIPHQLDDIDFVAEHQAQELIVERAEHIEGDKAAEVRAIFERLNLQFAGRRISDTVHVGSRAYEKEVFATRTPDCRALDEIFTRETTYFGYGFKTPEHRYEVEMLEADGSKQVVILEADGTMHFWHTSDEGWTELDEAGANATMFDLVMRAETAVGTYELRKEAAIAEGLDPTVYTDLADADAYQKMYQLGYKQLKGSITE